MRSQTSTPEEFNFLISFTLIWLTLPILADNFHVHFCNDLGFGERRVILDQFRKEKYKFVFFRITTKSPLAKGNSFTRYRRRYFLLLYIRSGYALRFYGIVFAAWLARQYLPPSLFLFIAITIYALVKRDAAQRCENRVDP